MTSKTTNCLSTNWIISVTQEHHQDLSEQLITIGDFIRYATSEFNRADLYFGHGSDNAWDEAITLIMYALELPDALTEHVMQCRLTRDEKLHCLSLIERRVTEQIPVSYITNQANFAGLPFYVDERVLVPRSPIGEWIEKRFEPLVAPDKEVSRILDLCTGSGCIAIACAHYFPEAEVDALDLSLDALEVAQINIENHGLSEQVIPIQSDIFSSIPEQKYDLIVTNPPYVDQEDVDNLPQEYLHEPEMGLGSGPDGLDITRVILAQAAEHLNENGILVCEVGNSMVHLEAAYPEVDFQWLSFERGGHGVFFITKEQLEQFQTIFEERVKR